MLVTSSGAGNLLAFHGPTVHRELQLWSEAGLPAAVALQAAAKGDTGAPLVFFCAGPRCWLSYNAALRAARLGYGNVLWYRGGIEAWGAGGGAL